MGRASRAKQERRRQRAEATRVRLDYPELLDRLVPMRLVRMGPDGLRTHASIAGRGTRCGKEVTEVLDDEFSWGAVTCLSCRRSEGPRTELDRGMALIAMKAEADWKARTG